MVFTIKKCNDFSPDGKLSSPEWEKAEVWEMTMPEQKVKEYGCSLREKGYVRMLYSPSCLYVGVDLEDSDVVNTGKEDGTALYKMGDTVELFFKPLEETYYWELYGTPHELKSTLFYPSCSYVDMIGTEEYKADFQVKTFVDGKMNDWKSVDKGWKIEFKLPLRVFEEYGAKFASGNQWQFLVGRQNFSRNLPYKEISTFPPIHFCHFHMLEQYGILIPE